MPQNKPCQGEFYRHFKNKMYQIIAIAEHSETGEEMVVYQALYDDYKTYVRPYQMFISEVDHEKYPEATQKYRFELVTPKTDTKTVVASPVHATEQVQESVQKITEEYDELTQVNPMLLRFLDEDDFDKKYAILTEMRNDITESLIDNLAASLDVVIPEGDLEDRYQQLKICVRTRQRFETNRFR